jgi:1-acyl-sn-glycerol-3-phosphate acyltransferase
MIYLFVLILLTLMILLWYSEIQILYFVLALILLLFLFYLSYYFYNIYILLIAIILFLVLIPSILFYFDLIYEIYPYITYKKNDIDGMKKGCQQFLDRHFKYKIINQKLFQSPVIYVLNHHTKYNKFLDMFSHLKIPGNNTIVVTGGKTRFVMIDTLYSNLNNIKLGKEEKGNAKIFMKKCKEKLKEGNNIVIFPEGKHTNLKENWNKMIQFQTGAFILSKECNIPIVPVIISGGNYDHGLIMHSNITMEYLDPFYPQNYVTIEDFKEDVFEHMNFSLSKM